MEDRGPILNYVPRRSDHAYQDRWSRNSIFSLVFALLTSPVVTIITLNNRHVYELVRDTGVENFSTAIITGAPIFGFCCAVAVTIRVSRSQGRRGFPFTIPAIMISTLGCLVSYMIWFGPQMGPQ